MSKEDGYVLCPRCKGRAKVEVEIAMADSMGVQFQGKNGRPIFRIETRPCPCANGERPGYTYMPPRVDKDGKVHWSKYHNEASRTY